MLDYTRHACILSSKVEAQPKTTEGTRMTKITSTIIDSGTFHIYQTTWSEMDRSDSETVHVASFDHISADNSSDKAIKDAETIRQNIQNGTN